MVGRTDEKLLTGEAKIKYKNNFELSIKRANAVGSILSKKFGISNYSVIGLSDNYHYKNISLDDSRRVDIYLSYGNEVLDSILQ